MPTPNKAPRRAAGAMAICVTLVGGFEGLRQTAYRDVIGVPTICFGETRGVKMGDTKTAEECRAMLAGRLQEFADGVAGCVPRFPDLPPARAAAQVSLAYNIGIGAYCRSSVARLLNAGQDRAACDAFLKWNRAAGVVFPGLTRRRETERALCMDGLG